MAETGDAAAPTPGAGGTAGDQDIPLSLDPGVDQNPEEVEQQEEGEEVEDQQVHTQMQLPPPTANIAK